jgi:hypothetical protein
MTATVLYPVRVVMPNSEQTAQASVATMLIAVAKPVTKETVKSYISPAMAIIPLRNSNYPTFAALNKQL